jgi:hypothetical protein
MTHFQDEEGQRIAEMLERIGVSQYRVGGMAVTFRWKGRTHVVSSEQEAMLLLYSFTHCETMDALRTHRRRAA